MEDTLENKVQYTIGFLRTMKMLSKKNRESSVKIPFDNLQIILEVLEDCKKAVKYNTNDSLLR